MATPPSRPRDLRGRYVPRAAPPLADCAMILVTMDRSTGQVDIDEEFSTPGETYAMLLRASQAIEERLNPQDTA